METNSTGVNPAITAYNAANVFLRENDFTDRVVTVAAGEIYTPGTVLAALEATGKLVAFDYDVTTGAENPAYILAEALDSSDAVRATAGNFLSADISANLAGIIALTDAEFTITVDGGTPEVVPAIDFTATGATTMADVADVLQVAIQESVVVEAINGNSIKISSASTGASSTIALADSAGAGTDFTGASYLNIAGGTITAGAAAVDKDFDNSRVGISGEVSSDLLVFPDSSTLDTIVSGKGKVKDLLKNNRIDAIAVQGQTALDNGASLS